MRFSLEGPTKDKACKSFLFTESSRLLKIKNVSGLKMRRSLVKLG